MEEQQTTVENWNPELGFLPKKEIEGKQHKTEIIKKYIEKEGKKTLYKVETYDSVFGNRQLQLNSVQALQIKGRQLPLECVLTSQKTHYEDRGVGKIGYRLKINFGGEQWF
jgi:hypothetical protein